MGISEAGGVRVSKVTLKLTELEAETLGRLLYCHIAGPDSGPRGVLSGICDKIPLDKSLLLPFELRFTSYTHPSVLDLDLDD